MLKNHIHRWVNIVNRQVPRDIVFIKQRHRPVNIANRKTPRDNCDICTSACFRCVVPGCVCKGAKGPVGFSCMLQATSWDINDIYMLMCCKLCDTFHNECPEICVRGCLKKIKTEDNLMHVGFPHVVTLNFSYRRVSRVSRVWRGHRTIYEWTASCSLNTTEYLPCLTYLME